MKAIVVLVALLAAAPALAQDRAGQLFLARQSDAFTLPDLQQAAVDADPRTRELQLLESQSSLRQRNIAVQRLPAIGVDGQTQYQTDAPSAPVLTPGSKPIFSAPKSTYDAYLRIDQRIWDPAVTAQAALERSQLAERQARVRSAVYARRQQVNDAFFAVAALQQREEAVEATLNELQGRLDEMNARVQSGTALPADAALIEATLLQRQQDFAELRANHSAAVARLATMVRRPLPRSAVMVLPDLNARVATARQQFQTPRARPEYEQFARTRERIAKQSDLTAAQSRPKLSAFGRAGYGRPGLDFIANEWQVYGVGGFRLQWNAWTWGSTGRERQASSLEQQITDADEAAFTQNLSENTENDVATIDRLMAALDLDDRIIALRTDVLRSVQVRLQEGVVTVSDYLARNAELLQARIALAAHQVELAQANAKFLTTLGLEVR